MGTEPGISCVLSSAGGGLGTPSVMDGPPLAVGEPPTRLQLLSTGGSVRLHYAVTATREEVMVDH